MRVEQQSTGRYNKYPDKVDAQLIRIINRYFNHVSSTDDKIVDAIIDEVLAKVKAELGIVGKPTTNEYSNEERNVVPKLLVDKKVTLKEYEEVEFLVDDPEDIKNIVLTIDGKNFYSRYGHCLCKAANDKIVELNVFHDTDLGKKVVALKNCSDLVNIKMKIFSWGG